MVIRSRGEPPVELRLAVDAAVDPRELRKPGFLIGTEWEHFELPEWSKQELDELFHQPLD